MTVIFIALPIIALGSIRMVPSASSAVVCDFSLCRFETENVCRHLEARGVEPLSSKQSTQTSTCLSGDEV